jgi:hypothetical protein
MFASVPDTLIRLDHISKKFCRTAGRAWLYGAADAHRRAFGRGVQDSPQAAGRCVLLLDGCAIAQGRPDDLLLKYYGTVGYLGQRIEPLSIAPEMPRDAMPAAWIACLRITQEPEGETPHGDPG